MASVVLLYRQPETLHRFIFAKLCWNIVVVENSPLNKIEWENLTRIHAKSRQRTELTQTKRSEENYFCNHFMILFCWGKAIPMLFLSWGLCASYGRSTSGKNWCSREAVVEKMADGTLPQYHLIGNHLILQQLFASSARIDCILVRERLKMWGLIKAQNYDLLGLWCAKIMKCRHFQMQKFERFPESYIQQQNKKQNKCVQMMSLKFSIVQLSYI